MKYLSFFAFCTVCIVPSLCATTVSDKLIANSLSFGTDINTGNSPTQEFTGEYKREKDISYPDSKLGYTAIIGGQWSTAQGIQNKKNTHTSFESKHQYSEKTYFFGKASYLYDAFATYDDTLNGTLGLGRVLFQNHQQKLTLEAGPGGTSQRVAGSNEKKESLLGHGAISYKYTISKTASFTQTGTIDTSSYNTHFQSVSAITSTLVKDIALKISFTVNSDTNIPENSSNTKRTDTETSATILYNF